jgi:hypothetical protein
VKVGAIAAMGDQQFNAAVNDTADSIDASVKEVSGSQAQDVRKNTNAARQRNVDLTAMIANNDQTSFQVRTDILHDFANALASAGLALQAQHSTAPLPTFPPAGVFPAAVTAAAQAVATAIAANPNYCALIAQPGSALNAAVHAFKTAWNVTQPTQIPIGTSNYEQQTAEVLADVLGGAPLPCEPHATTTPNPIPDVAVTVPQKSQPLSTGAVVSIGLLSAGALGGAVYLATRKSKR